MKLALNLASGNARRGAWRPWLLGAGLALGLGLSAVHALYFASLVRGREPAERKLRQLEAEVEQLETRVRSANDDPREKLGKSLATRVDAYNRIIEAAAFSWTSLLTELEKAVPSGVSLSAIQPDPRTGKVSLSGAAKRFEDVATFLRLLQQSPAFRDVYLLRQGAKPVGQLNLVEFTITAGYGRGQG